MPRGTGQPHKEQANKHRDVNKGDEEDVCNTRMKSMTSRWSNTTHEENHDANDDDDDDDEEEEDEQVQHDVTPKKKNTCNRQFRSTDSDANDSVSNEKPNNNKNNEVPS